MSTTLPAWTRTIDNAFVQTWYEIRPEAVDNILLATPVTAKLKANGCFKTQRGGNLITRTVKYATTQSQVQGVAKGDILNGGEIETQTMARWPFRYFACPIQRSTIDDQQNSGKFQIKSYIAQRMEEAREALTQQLEVDFYRATDTTEAAHKFIQSLLDIVPAVASKATGTYGSISRANTWWQPQYLQWTAPKEVNLLTNMKTLWNNCGKQQSYPDLIVTDQTTFELYEDFALDQAQIVKNGSGGLADLGFDTLKFKGCEMIWSANVTAGNLYMYNTRRMEFIYDPQYWFEMSEWKPIPNQMERLAHILCAGNLICTELRRQGLAYN